MLAGSEGEASAMQICSLPTANHRRPYAMQRTSLWGSKQAGAGPGSLPHGGGGGDALTGAGHVAGRLRAAHNSLRGALQLPCSGRISGWDGELKTQILSNTVFVPRPPPDINSVHVSGPICG